VIVSYGADNDSKVVKRSFSFDSPIFDVGFIIFLLKVISIIIFFSYIYNRATGLISKLIQVIIIIIFKK